MLDSALGLTEKCSNRHCLLQVYFQERIELTLNVTSDSCVFGSINFNYHLLHCIDIYISSLSLKDDVFQNFSPLLFTVVQ